MTSDFSTSRSDPRIVGDRSMATASVTAPGMEASSCGSRARTRSTVSMMFAPGCRNRITSTAGFPLASPAARRSSTESCTSATSDSRTADPFLYPMTSGMYWFAVRIWSLAVSSHVRVASESCPLGRFAFVACNTRRTLSRPIPYLFSAMGLRSTRTAGSELPPTNTCPIPSTWESFWARMVEAASYIFSVPTAFDVSDRIMMGASAGLTFR